MKNTIAGLQLVCLAVIAAAVVPIALNQMEARSLFKARTAQASALSTIGEAALKVDDASLAAQAFADAVGLSPEDEHLRARLLHAQVARLMVDGGVINNSNALSFQVALTRALSGSGAVDSQHLLAFGRVLQYRGRIEDARAKYSQAVEQSPKSALAHLFLGDLHLKLGEHEAAARNLTKALALDDTLVMAKIALGQTYLAQKRPDEARPMLEAAVKVVPTDARAFAALGRAALELKDYAAARKALERSVRLDPKITGNYGRLGTAWLGLKNPERAVQAFLRAWSKGRDPEGLRQAGRIRMNQKQWKAAFSTFQELVTVVPDDVEGHYMSAGAAHAMGEVRVAVAAYTRAISHATDSEADAKVVEQAKGQIAAIKQAVQDSQKKPGKGPKNP